MMSLVHDECICRNILWCQVICAHQVEKLDATLIADGSSGTWYETKIKPRGLGSIQKQKVVTIPVISDHISLLYNRLYRSHNSIFITTLQNPRTDDDTRKLCLAQHLSERMFAVCDGEQDIGTIAQMLTLEVKIQLRTDGGYLCP
ncbi:hypothetical protein Mapa_009323 [Marchantia paleacea]|nr:hypothetical protein Mapa_009323 [Marchantia paleacea]